MNEIQKVAFPQNSILSATNADYVDCYSGVCNDPNNALDALLFTKTFFSSSPKWVNQLFQFRNKLVGSLGLKTGNPSAVQDRAALLEQFQGEKGESIGLFKVFDRSPSEIILGEDDKHLDFRISFLVDSIEESKKNLVLSTTVNFKNNMGKLYFLPVKPFHQIIAPLMLKSIIKELEGKQ